MNNSELRKNIGNLIKTERERQNLTQEELASMINMDANNLSRIETGKNYPAFPTFCAIVEALNIEPNALLNFLKYNKFKYDNQDIQIIENINSLPENTKSAIIQLIKAV